MKSKFDEGSPIFQQIAQMIEDDILNGIYEEDGQVMSTTQFAKIFKINPATAVKGINQLVEQGILYKKRGLGMFVVPGAKDKILDKRKNAFYHEYVMKLIYEAQRIQLTKEDVINMIRKVEGSW